MRAIGYLYGRSLINRVKKALRKPVTYFILLLFLFYFTPEAAGQEAEVRQSPGELAGAWGAGAVLQAVAGI